MRCAFFTTSLDSRSTFVRLSREVYIHPFFNSKELMVRMTWSNFGNQLVERRVHAHDLGVEFYYTPHPEVLNPSESNTSK